MMASSPKPRDEHIGRKGGPHGMRAHMQCCRLLEIVLAGTSGFGAVSEAAGRHEIESLQVRMQEVKSGRGGRCWGLSRAARGRW